MNWKEALKTHWPEYLIEATLLGLFMISACSFVALLQHPSSPVRMAIPSDFVRGMLTGIAMGLTAMCLIYSPWGRQSGAHMNPSITLTFYRLGKVPSSDAFFYILSQFIGGVLGVAVSLLIYGSAVRHPSVNYVATLPGPFGAAVAFVAEVAISFFMMSMVLRVSNHPRFSRFTGIFAGCLVALYITFEGPLSGMSMNPARTFGSAFFAHSWSSLWIYFFAPLLGMFAAAETYLQWRGISRVFCAKFDHDSSKRCIFRCNYAALLKSTH